MPDELRDRVVEQADGIPLYAVETVRMLIDRGLLTRSGEEYRPVGPIETLAIPETLQSLAAARLDSLDPSERRLLEDASVLGRTFTRGGLAAVSGLGEDELEPHLQSLLRKEILTRQLDALSPERNQVAFLQDVLRRVAYETLSVHDRKLRHLAAAAHLAQVGDEDIAAVLAAHYIDAYRLATGDPDANGLRELACGALVRAAERASSLASAGEAARYFQRAAELTDSVPDRAELLERAGREAGKEGDFDVALDALKEAGRLLDELGEPHAAARVAARRAEVFRAADRVGDALALMRPAYDELIGGERNPDVALVAAQLARIAYFAGERDLALEVVEVALDMGEIMQLPEVLAEALPRRRRSSITGRTRRERCCARRSGSPAPSTSRKRCYVRNSTSPDWRSSTTGSTRHARFSWMPSHTLSFGATARGVHVIGQLGEVLVLAGEWDEAWQLVDPLELSAVHDLGTSMRLDPAVNLLIGRGYVAEARALLDHAADFAESTDLQSRAIYLVDEASVCIAEGRYVDAVDAAHQSVGIWRALNQPHYEVLAYAAAIDATLALGDLERARALLDQVESMPAVERRAFVDAQASRLAGKIAAQRGEDSIDDFATAAQIFRDIRIPFWLARHARRGDRSRHR